MNIEAIVRPDLLPREASVCGKPDQWHIMHVREKAQKQQNRGR